MKEVYVTATYSLVPPNVNTFIITLHGVIIARNDAILDQSERVHLHNHLSNYTNSLFRHCLVSLPV